LLIAQVVSVKSVAAPRAQADETYLQMVAVPPILKKRGSAQSAAAIVVQSPYEQALEAHLQVLVPSPQAFSPLNVAQSES